MNAMCLDVARIRLNEVVRNDTNTNPADNPAPTPPLTPPPTLTLTCTKQFYVFTLIPAVATPPDHYSCLFFYCHYWHKKLKKYKCLYCNFILTITVNR